MQVRVRFRIAAGCLACFAAGILVTDTAYKLDGAAAPAIDPSIVSLVLACVSLLLAIKGWSKDRAPDTAIQSPQ